MNKLMNTAAINASIRGLVCAGLATAITASFSWSFVAATDSFDWMGSSTLRAPEVAMLQERNSRPSRVT